VDRDPESASKLARLAASLRRIVRKRSERSQGRKANLETLLRKAFTLWLCEFFAMSAFALVSTSVHFCHALSE
jgi:hypothetical protein